MNMIVTLPRQSFLRRLAGAIGLFRAAGTRSGPRYVNIGEFSPHLQRDMGFLDGRAAPGAESGPGFRGPDGGNWMR